MLLYILLILKLILFYTETKVQFAPMLVFFMDFAVITAFYILLRKRGKKVRVLNFVLYALLSLIMFADVVYFSYFNRMPVISELGHAGNLGGVTDAVKRLFNFKNLILILDLPITGYIYFKGYLEKLLKKNFFDIYISRYISLSVVALVLLAVFVFSGSKMASASRLSLFGYHIRDIAESVSKPGELHEDDVSESMNNLNKEKYENEYTGIAKGKNFIHIQIESLNNFVIGREYNGEEITPNLNRLIEETGSIYCKNYIEMLGAGNTSDAEFVSLHSLYPTMRAQSYEAYIDTYLYGLPKIFADNNYAVDAFHGYKRDFWMRDRVYPHLGIDNFYAEDDFDLDDMIGMGLSDESFLRQSFDIISRQSEPFYSFLITLSSHVPYEMPDYDGSLSAIDKDKDTFFFRYLNAVHYTDKALGEFLDKLKENGMFENSVIALYGDHHGITGVEADAMLRVAEFIGKKFDFDELMNVPLIIHVPGLEEKKTIESVRSQLDFMPTILNLFGIDASKYVTFGHDIFDENHPSVAFPEGYMRKGSFISDDYIFTMKRDGIFENGTLVNRKTGEETPPNEEAKKLYKQAIKEITLSNKILDTNSIEKLMAKGNKDELVNDYEKPSDAVVVETKDELESAIQNGYKYFYLSLKKTLDEYYVTNPNGENMNFEAAKTGYISLGDVLGKYKNYKFIVDTNDPREFAFFVKTVDGNHDSLIIKANSKDEYEEIFYRKNGYNILLDVSDYTEDEVKSIKLGMPDLLIYGGDLTEFKDQTFREMGEVKEGELAIIPFEKIEKTDSKAEIKTVSEEFIIPDGDVATSLREISKRAGDEFVPIKVYYDAENDEVKLNMSDSDDPTALFKLMEKNKNIKIYLTADGAQVEIMRALLKLNPPKERVMVELITPGQVSFATKMGFTNLVLNMNIGENELEELEQIYMY